jgi:nucleotide-binding universal stress UspA family protein
VPSDATDRDSEEDLSLRRLGHVTGGLAAAFPDLELVFRSVHGPAVEVLVDFSHRSELLVVGGREGSATPVPGLGPVARALVEQARCPLMVCPAGALRSPAAGDGVTLSNATRG